MAHGCDGEQRASNRACEQGNRIRSVVEVVSGNVIENLADGPIDRAHTRGQHTSAVAVLYGSGLGSRQSALNGKIKPSSRCGRSRSATIFYSSNIDGTDASLQLIKLQVNGRLIIKHTLGVGGAHILAPANDWGFDESAIGRAGGKQRQRSDTDIVDAKAHIFCGIPGNGLNGRIAVGIGKKIVPLIALGIGIEPSNLEGGGNWRCR